LFALLAGSGIGASQRSAGKALAAPAPANTNVVLPRMDIRLMATDGWMSLPGRRTWDPDGRLYGFGFRGVEPSETFASPEELIRKYKGRVQWPAPPLAIPKNVDLYVTLTNLGLEVRPDLDDAHTIHWHGFRNPNAVFDGVPEVSISVPPARDFPYFYRTRVEGTYMYHCHFEDTEHVQMGMDGVAWIQASNGNTYDDDGGTTAFDREFYMLLNEIDTTPHDNLAAVQEFVWSNYKANYWVINGRSYPDTVVRDQDLATYQNGDLAESQPISSLVQVEEGERALLRIASLGYEQHAMQMLGLRMQVVGHDAVPLYRQSTGVDRRYETSTVYIGPGESRDVLITAPAYSASLPGGVDGAGPYNRYWFRNRNSQRLHNGTEPGIGGMVTEVRVYPAGALGPQPGPNITV
jgi:hypothetical protein